MRRCAKNAATPAVHPGSLPGRPLDWPTYRDRVALGRGTETGGGGPRMGRSLRDRRHRRVEWSVWKGKQGVTGSRKPLERDEQALAHGGGVHRSGRTAGPERQGTADAALGLQASAGNTAVTHLLAGDGPAVLRRSLQREAAPPGAGSAAADTGSAAADARDKPGPAGAAVMSIPELGKPIPLISFSPGTQRRGGPGGGAGGRPGGGAGGGRGGDSTISVTVTDGPIAARLAQAAGEGQHFPAVTISTAPVTYAMKDVVFTSIAMTKDSTDVTLDYQSISYHYRGS